MAFVTGDANRLTADKFFQFFLKKVLTGHTHYGKIPPTANAPTHEKKKEMQKKMKKFIRRQTVGIASHERHTLGQTSTTFCPSLPRTKILNALKYLIICLLVWRLKP